MTTLPPDPHPLIAGMLDDMQRTYARMARQPQTVVCRCQRFAWPHEYEPACAVVAVMEGAT